MGTVERRAKLAEEPFTYREMGQGSLFIYWRGKHVRTVKGSAAEKLLAQLADAEPKQVQFVLAKATGNFKRGNERSASDSHES